VIGQGVSEEVALLAVVVFWIPLGCFVFWLAALFIEIGLGFYVGEWWWYAVVVGVAGAWVEFREVPYE